MGNKKIKLTSEEIAIREKEDQLFDKLKSPPSRLGGVMDVLGDEDVSKSLLEQRETERTKRRKEDLEKAKTLKKASSGK